MIDDLYSAMPWDEIDAVVFDVGNVLLTFDPDRILREYLPDREDLYPLLMERVFQSPYWVSIDHGDMPLDMIVEYMIGSHEEIREAVNTLMTNWIEMKWTLPGVDVLKECKRRGKRLYVLSNYGDQPFAAACEKHEFFKLFDRLFVSARLRMTKPDPAIYRHVIAETGELPERTLFLDDNISNIHAALFAGWQGYVVRDPQKMLRFMGLAE